MVVRNDTMTKYRSGYAGLRLTADEYFALPDDGNRYELIDGVVSTSPSPSANHQRVSRAIFRQLDAFVEQARIGEVFYEIDVQLGKSADGRDIVYCPDVMCFLGKASHAVGGRFRIVPAVVVEVVSPESPSRDYQTKRDDYERFGVAEYWLIDPIAEEMHFYRLANGSYVEAVVDGVFYESEVVAGFRLDLVKVRGAFRAIG